MEGRFNIEKSRKKWLRNSYTLELQIYILERQGHTLEPKVIYWNGKFTNAN